MSDCDCCGICSATVSADELLVRGLWCREWGHHATHRSELTVRHPTEPDALLMVAEVAWDGPSCDQGPTKEAS